MGLRQTLKRLSTVRDRSRGNAPIVDGDADARAPINSPNQTLEEDSGDESADRRFSDILEVSLDAKLPSAAERTGPLPRKPTGKRKPGHTTKLRHNHTVRRARSVEPKPQDYLYFGEGGSSAGVARSSLHQSQPPRAASSGAVEVKSSNTQSTGRDASGFLNTGMSNHQMAGGYQALTYGGSLQYDYAGVQAPGVDGL
ncbi:hypothetical protein PFICI_01103 [Pestalotiopsis fici W106-1]|uniref:Uncharacterized protein n=1 Tax=Pestalotiopsis fici (strain W106-1 / CGMCC3.15140) TaxID=1229662 RepID=W3XMW7_PESFW|nr:uncharacterized protein PFICI_01103 [Pestalotiopsis fici W106-1]ETS87275.1 hypothetical protein PFICI_01103 [Pestalotiopsis fici W106-1]